MNKQSVFGIASMVIGIISLLFSCLGLGFLGIIGCILAIIGITQRGRAKGTAIAGLITSVVAFLVSFLVITVGISIVLDDEEKDNKATIVTDTEEDDNSPDITEFSFDEMNLYNKKGITIKATGNKSDDSPKIGIFVENNYKGDITVSIDGIAINNICCGENYTYEEIMSGSKSNFTIDIDADWAENNNITSIKKVDMLFEVFSDNEDFEPICIVKTIKTNNDDNQYQKAKGDKIYSDKNIDIIYLESNDSDYKFAIYSKYKKYLDYSIEKCSINGYSYDLTDNDSQVYEEPLFPKSYGVFEISVKDEFREKNSIDKIEKIEFKISADSDATTTRIMGDGDITSKKIVFNAE